MLHVSERRPESIQQDLRVPVPAGRAERTDGLHVRVGTFAQSRVCGELQTLAQLLASRSLHCSHHQVHQGGEYGED